MGKLSGILMGCDCCYINYVDVDQNFNENLMILLVIVGCNYIMGMLFGDDIMFNYQIIVFYDIVIVCQLLGLWLLLEFECWLEMMGIMVNGCLIKWVGDLLLFF